MEYIGHPPREQDIQSQHKHNGHGMIPHHGKKLTFGFHDKNTVIFPIQFELLFIPHRLCTCQIGKIFFIICISRVGKQNPVTRTDIYRCMEFNLLQPFFQGCII